MAFIKVTSSISGSIPRILLQMPEMKPSLSLLRLESSFLSFEPPPVNFLGLRLELETDRQDSSATAFLQTLHSVIRL